MNRLILRRIVQLDSQARQLESDDLDEQAVELREEVCQLVQDHLGENHPWRVSRLFELAATCRRSGDVIRAEEIYRDLIRRLEERQGEEPLDFARSLNALGVLYCETDHHQGAIHLFDRALEISRQQLSSSDPGLAAILNNLAGAQHALCQYRQAERSYLEALGFYEEAGIVALAEQAHCQCDLAELAADEERTEECKARAQNALRLYRSAHSESDPLLARALIRLAHLYRRVQCIHQAIDLFEEAAQILQGAGETRENELAYCLDRLSEIQQLHRSKISTPED